MCKRSMNTTLHTFQACVTVHLHPIFVRFAPLTYNRYASGAETNEPGAHLNGYSLRVEGNLLPRLNGYGVVN